MSENGIRRCDAAMASEGQIQTTAETESPDGRERRRWKMRYQIHEMLAFASKAERVRAVELSNLVQVGATRKDRLASDDQW